jgi:multidrug transporter EmrE-like cation transporter
MLRKWMWFLLLLVTFELLADVLAKQFAISGDLWLAVGAIACFLLANISWLVSLRSGAELSTGMVIFSVLSSIGAVLIGLVVYHEELGTYGIFGLALGILAIALLSFGGTSSA